MKQTPNFFHGLRVSVFDGLILLVGMLSAILVASIEFWFGIVIAFVVLHFFLFCNVILIARAYELIWAGCFVALAASTILTGIPSWPLTLLVSFVVTAILVIIQIQKSSYRGVPWKKQASMPPAPEEAPTEN